MTEPYVEYEPQRDPIKFYPDVNDFIKAVIKRNQTHGEEFFDSAHTGYGAIAEEFNLELLKAIHENDKEQIMNEAMDVAVAAFHLYRTMKYGK